MNKKIILILIGLITGISILCFADDGTYDATVTTDSGSYSVPVEVEDNEVTIVHWPNGGDMTVSGAEISDSEADGVNSRGDSIHIAIDDYESTNANGE